MQDFINLLKTEFLKTKRSLVLWSTILLPLAICGFVSIGFYIKSDRVIKYPPELQWIHLIGSINSIMGIILLPMFIVFLSYAINNIEHEADSWKSLFSLPISRWNIYISKYIFVLFLSAICLFAFPLFILIFGNFLVFLEPKLQFDEYSVVYIIFKTYFKLFLSSIGILTVQFFFSVQWNNFIKSMGLGLAGTIVGLICVQTRWEYAWLIPYSHPSLTINTINFYHPHRFNVLSTETLCSLIIGIAFFIFGYIAILRKNS